MPGLQGLDGLTTAHQMSKVIVNDTTRTRGAMGWSSRNGLPRQHASPLSPRSTGKHRERLRSTIGGHYAWTVGTGDVTFILLRSFIRASLLHCASQTHLCTRHNVLSAPVKRAIVCGKPFGRKVAQKSACHAFNHVSRKSVT